MAASEQRFIRTYVQSGLKGTLEIWVDRNTGVNYMYRSSGYGAGLTPLLNTDGTPQVTPLGPDS